ncbi:hypothetical protein [Arachnia propionica]|uniref:hypothetical protein n=1 Tax=Arachnia propionica TaxID=1750 RepID=UPI0037BF5A1E
MRPAYITPYPGAHADSTFPTMKNPSNATSAHFGDRRISNGVRISAPGATARAYTPTS